jgi:phage terminase large subunit-like protein
MMTGRRPEDSFLVPLDPKHRFLLSLPDEERLAVLRSMSEAERSKLRFYWRLWARKDQIEPKGDWRLWLIQAGRGFGKTRAGAEWVREIAEVQSGARIALLAASLGEGRSIMVEGDSGILSVSPNGQRPKFESSMGRLTWPNGSQATLFSAGEPESLRGPQHSHACRTIAKRSLRK